METKISVKYGDGQPVNTGRNYAQEVLADVRAEVLPNLRVCERAAEQTEHLRAVNAELVAALQACIELLVDLEKGGAENPELGIARAALAKAQR